MVVADLLLEAEEGVQEVPEEPAWGVEEAVHQVVVEDLFSPLRQTCYAPLYIALTLWKPLTYAAHVLPHLHSR